MHENDNFQRISFSSYIFIRNDCAATARARHHSQENHKLFNQWSRNEVIASQSSVSVYANTATTKRTKQHHRRSAVGCRSKTKRKKKSKSGMERQMGDGVMGKNRQPKLIINSLGQRYFTSFIHSSSFCLRLAKLMKQQIHFFFFLFIFTFCLHRRLWFWSSDAPLRQRWS